MKSKLYPIFMVKLLFLFSIIIPLSFTGCSNQKIKQIPSAHPVAVRVVKPIIKNMEKQITYIGTVNSKREVRVIAQVQGTLIALPIAEGEKVTKGNIVAEIDVPDIRATVERLKAERDYWSRRYESDKRLVQSEAIPQEQLEVSLRASKSAQAALNEAEVKLAKAREQSPITGTVLSWLVEPGQNVMPGQPLLLLGDNNLEIHVEVVEEDLQRGIQTGIPVEVNDWQGNSFRSVVSEIAPFASGSARTFTIKIPVWKEHATDLRVGASMRVGFVLHSSASTVAVPVDAVVQENGKTYLFLVRNNEAIKKNVNTGIEQNGLIAVSFPWNEGDLVAVSNLRSLRDSISVFPVSIEEAQ